MVKQVSPEFTERMQAVVLRLARTRLHFTSDDIFQATFPNDKWPDEARMLALTSVMVRAQFYGTVVRVHDRGWRSCIYTGRIDDGLTR